MQSALSAHGPQAAYIAELTWVLLVGGVVIFALVMALAAVAAWRRPAWLASDRAVIAGGIALPLVVLSALLVYSLAMSGTQQGPPDLRVELIGHQWWWRVRYLDDEGTPQFETANEIRVPAGEQVEIALRSADVLHSFWVPSLAGKLDLIPGKDNRLRLSAPRPGLFRGQCAEYCGGPHAQMALFVVSMESDEFEAWLRRQGEPATSSNVVFNARCAACHTVRGTAARGTLGPDLTHLGSRVSIGAGLLPNNRGTLAGWISSSQHLKPGNLMPEFSELSAMELQALAAYLEGLK
jgi:cytochrome c oxidase subunit II